MIERPLSRIDRLAALLAALAPEARGATPGDPDAALLILGPGRPERVALRLSGAPPSAVVPEDALAAAAFAFATPPAAALPGAPALIEVALADDAALAALAVAYVGEAREARCGAAQALARIAEAMLVIALRKAIDGAAAGPGVMAGLAHPRLHRALAAIHDAPGAAWSVEALAAVAGMSRSRFMAAFARVVGVTPAAYLSGWRMGRARVGLRAGRPVKEVARLAGFASTAAFSRAYARAHGAPPSRHAGRSGAA